MLESPHFSTTPAGRCKVKPLSQSSRQAKFRSIAGIPQRVTRRGNPQASSASLPTSPNVTAWNGKSLRLATASTPASVRTSTTACANNW